MTTGNNDITELRGHLFYALRELKNKDAPMDIERAKAIAEVAQTVINSAKVECEHMKIVGSTGSGFIPLAAPTPAPDTTIVTQRPGVRVTRHTLKG